MAQPARNRIVGTSRRTVELREKLSLVARAPGSVVLHGEVGAGKELAARTLHRESARSRGPFRMVDCARFFPEDLTAILFGTEERPGTALLGRADRGTLYIVHPEEAILSVQERLAGFMATGRFRAGRRGPEAASDVRIVAGSEKDLSRHAHGALVLRELWEAMAGEVVELAPLRERREDIRSVVSSIAGEAAADRFSPGVLLALEGYPWPGNYDELLEEIERLLRTGHARIEVEHLRRDIVGYEPAAACADPEIFSVIREIEQCIEAFHVNDAADLDFAPYFWHGGPVPDQQYEAAWESEPWEKDVTW
jgi:DNA-binding NtrC family response regulator